MVSSIRSSRARLSRVAATRMMNEQRDALGLRRVHVSEVETMSVREMLEELNRLAVMSFWREQRTYGNRLPGLWG